MLGSCNLNCRGHLDLHPNWASRLSSTDPGSISMQSNLPVWYSSAPTSHVKEYYPMSDIPVTNGLTHILFNSDSNQPKLLFRSWISTQSNPLFVGPNSGLSFFLSQTGFDFWPMLQWKMNSLMMSSCSSEPWLQCCGKIQCFWIPTALMKEAKNAGNGRVYQNNFVNK